MDVGFNYFIVKFDVVEDRDKVIGEGPWTLNGYYLVVKQWMPSFTPREESFGCTMVWIRSLALTCYIMKRKQKENCLSSGETN